jgi:hypothetical protein
MLTLNVPYLQAALLSTSTSEIRYYLCGVQILRRGDHLRIASTDGHRLFCASQHTDHAGPDFDIILPRVELKKALTGLNRKVEALDLELTHLEPYPGQSRVTRAVLNNLSMQPIDGTFPSIERVVPGEPSGELTQFNPLYLADLGKQAKILSGIATGLHIGYNGQDPALISFQGAPDAFAVLMPYRVKMEPLHRAAVTAIMGADRPAAEKAA